MTQADRDRFVALKKAALKGSRSGKAAQELELSERQVRRLMNKLQGGEQDLLHGLHRSLDRTYWS